MRGVVPPGVVVPLHSHDNYEGVDHGRQRHRLTLVAGELRTGEHQQVGPVATQPSGQMTQPEQAVQPFGVLLVALQAIDQRQLMIDQ